VVEAAPVAEVTETPATEEATTTEEKTAE
jgi:hypothetical protein